MLFYQILASQAMRDRIMLTGRAVFENLATTPSRGKKSQQRNTIRSGPATPIYLARIHAYLGIGSDKSALLRMARRRTRSEKEVEHSLIGKKLFQISSEKFLEKSVD